MALLSVLGGYFGIKCRLWRGGIREILLLPFRKNHTRNGISPFAAAATAIGGTVGMGSIIGVGVAISVGGAGSIFWMWICSLLGIGLKYAETRIALSQRISKNKINSGGAHCRLFALGYKKTAVAFCVFCVGCSFTTGNLTQLGAAGEMLSRIGIDIGLASVVAALCIGLCVLGGRKRIAQVNSIAVPIASALYIFACIIIIALNAKSILPSLLQIVKNAFGFSAAAGGFSGALLSRTMSEGFARSMFSNEAGMGSSPLAHASTEADDTLLQAKWGIFEVVFDSFGVSTLTALCLLTSGCFDCFSAFGLAFGRFGVYLLCLLCLLFAFASVISWCYYAECCISFFFDKGKALKLYRICFTLLALFGMNLPMTSLLAAADILNALMMLPNLFLLFKCRGELEGME